MRRPRFQTLDPEDWAERLSRPDVTLADSGPSQPDRSFYNSSHLEVHLLKNPLPQSKKRNTTPTPTTNYNKDTAKPQAVSTAASRDASSPKWLHANWRGNGADADTTLSQAPNAAADMTPRLAKSNLLLHQSQSCNTEPSKNRTSAWVDEQHQYAERRRKRREAAASKAAASPDSSHSSRAPEVPTPAEPPAVVEAQDREASPGTPGPSSPAALVAEVAPALAAPSGPVWDGGSVTRREPVPLHVQRPDLWAPLTYTTPSFQRYAWDPADWWDTLEPANEATWRPTSAERYTVFADSHLGKVPQHQKAARPPTNVAPVSGAKPNLIPGAAAAEIMSSKQVSDDRLRDLVDALPDGDPATVCELAVLSDKVCIRRRLVALKWERGLAGLLDAIFVTHFFARQDPGAVTVGPLGGRPTTTPEEIRIEQIMQQLMDATLACTAMERWPEFPAEDLPAADCKGLSVAADATLRMPQASASALLPTAATAAPVALVRGFDMLQALLNCTEKAIVDMEAVHYLLGAHLHARLLQLLDCLRSERCASLQVLGFSSADVAQHRPELVVQALTVLRQSAWHSRDRPQLESIIKVCHDLQGASHEWRAAGSGPPWHGTGNASADPSRVRETAEQCSLLVGLAMYQTPTWCALCMASQPPKRCTTDPGCGFGSPWL